MKHCPKGATDVEETPDIELAGDGGFLPVAFPWPLLPFTLLCFATLLDFATELILACAALVAAEDMTRS
jgi:hypothetical protein